ncbi:protein dpy-30 homolog [Agrilus planipennis]|uniref:Protein dpy-30 homolog n=1 Tax=Agrilus planipennis TaxID=224129 RepID=A0A1W4XJW8_AGRPL|nr:protein dpy-30 homolog [Agrilus planipennis]XP_018336274.1 protein dpy-30 homolog [Agrilus planipennis]
MSSQHTSRSNTVTSANINIDDVSAQKPETDSEIKVPLETKSDSNCNLFQSPKFCQLIKTLLQMENKEEFQPKKSRVDLASLPTRQYLDQTVVPILLQGLSYLSKERPPEPINALAAFLLKHRSTYEGSPNSSPPETERKS